MNNERSLVRRCWAPACLDISCLLMPCLASQEVLIVQVVAFTVLVLFFRLGDQSVL